MAPRAKPFLKWAGGKARSADKLAQNAPPFGGVYREPFMGSAAVFFALRPVRAVLSDANEDLVVCFQEVRRDPEAVMEALDSMVNSRVEFARIRGLDPRDLDPVQRSVRVIYLKKTAFRGLWRPNRSGQFNTPYGEYQRPCYNRDNLLGASRLLANARLECLDFAPALSAAAGGDFVYLDPPYVPETKWGDFRRYTAGQFDDTDHERLSRLMWEATARGVYVMLTNSDMPPVRRIYDGFRMTRISTRRDIHLKSSLRNSKDLVITNYVGDAIIRSTAAGGQSSTSRITVAS
ncbi:MAG: DNA adenine methylase [Chloroflexota bacterium]